jgi:hypothetical protein
MKKITLLFLSVLFIATYSLHAQKQFAGEIHYKTKIEGTEDPNLTSSLESMTVVVSILGNKSKTYRNFEMSAFTSIWDGDKETSIFIIEVTGIGKYYKKTTADEHNDKIKFSDFNYNYTNEFKNICDYKCQKVIVTVTNLEDDSTTETVLYVTKEIGTAKTNGEEYPGLEGYPLIIMQALPQYCDECMFTMEATKVNAKKIKDVDFLLPDDAKNIDDNPEIKEMFGLE